MNSRQKEVQQQYLNNEKAVLKKLEQNYKDALAEINSKIELLMSRQDADMQHVIYQVEYQKSLKKQVEAILETLHSNEFETVSEYLTKSYEDGFIGTMYDLQGQGIPLVFPLDQEQVVAAIQHETKLSENLYSALGKDTKELSKQIAGEISRGIAGGQMYAEIARNIAGYSRIPKNNAMRIARTEAHRIQCKATMDACYKAKDKGADVVKQWDASLDGKTRDTHRQLDGQIRELDEPFEVVGKKAMQPSGFGDPAEDCNCRCALLQRARWALGNNYTKWSPDAPVVIDDDGTTQYTIIEAKNYEQFQKKYKQAYERVRQVVQKISDHVYTLSEYNVDGTTYMVDGKHVILDSKKHEKEVAEIIGSYLDKEVKIIPRVVYPQGVSTPDYLIEGEKYDLKEPHGRGNNALFNMVHKKKNQANNFVFDISKSGLTIEEADEQIKKLYTSKWTSFVNEVILMKDGKVINKYKK